MANVSDRLKQLRGPLSQAYFAKKTGISLRALINYEQGVRTPNSLAIEKICARTGVSSDWLLFGKSDPVADTFGPNFADLVNSPEDVFTDKLVRRRHAISDNLKSSYKEASDWLIQVEFASHDDFTPKVTGREYFEREKRLCHDMEVFSAELYKLLDKHGGWLFFGYKDKHVAEETTKISNIGDFLESKKSQSIEINKQTDITKSPTAENYLNPPEDASASLALVAMSHELMEAVKEIRALNAEKRDLQNRIAELEKNVEALTAKASTAPAASAAQKSDSANEVPTITPLASPTAPNNHVK